MHDLAPHLETVVVDDPDARPWSPPPRAEVVMHVQLLYGDGLKHRLMPGHLALACETDKLDHANVNILPEKLDGEGYCPVCFTPAEIKKALDAIAKRRSEAESFVGMAPLSKNGRARARGYTAAPKPRK